MFKSAYIYSYFIAFLILSPSCADQPKSPPEERAPEKPTPPIITPPPGPAPPPTNIWQEKQLSAQEFEQAFAHKNKYLVSNAQIQERYALNKVFQGKADSHVLSVTLKEPPRDKRVLKVLAAFKDGDTAWDHNGFREIYFAKRLSDLKSHINLSHNQKASMFFPKFYGFGFVQSPNPFTTSSHNIYYPYYVVEEIEGLTFIDFVRQPAQAKKILGFSYDSASPCEIFSILLQIGTALLNAKAEIGFMHNDLHPQNIILSTTPIDMSFTSQNTPIKLKGPLIKILDFEHGEVPEHESVFHAFKTMGRKLFGLIGPTEEFYLKVNPTGSWGTLMFNCYLASPNMDMFLLNIYLHTFQKKFLSAGLDISTKYFYAPRGFTDYLRLHAPKFCPAQP